MKMKEACGATSLTERAIRLYLAKNLLAPSQRNGVLDFSSEDIRALKDIAALRRCDFTVKQISDMLRDASAIPHALLSRMNEAESKITHERDVIDALCKLRGVSFDSVAALVARMQAENLVPLEPSFARFDEISEEDRQRETQTATLDLAHRERRGKLGRVLIRCGGALAALAIAVAVFLSYTRLAGYISLAPVTLLEKHPGNIVTLSIGNAWAAEIIGGDTITVPISAANRWGTELIGDIAVPFDTGITGEAEQTIDRSVQLSIRLTNLDLLRLGVNPFQPCSAKDADAWRRMVVRALFAGNPGKAAELWIHEISNQAPLFAAASSQGQ